MQYIKMNYRTESQMCAHSHTEIIIYICALWGGGMVTATTTWNVCKVYMTDIVRGREKERKRELPMSKWRFANSKRNTDEIFCHHLNAQSRAQQTRAYHITIMRAPYTCVCSPAIYRDIKSRKAVVVFLLSFLVFSCLFLGAWAHTHF